MSRRAPGQSSKRTLRSSSPAPAMQDESASAQSGSQPKKAKKQTAAAAAYSAAATAAPQPGSALHTHALQSIFASVSLYDLCARVSHVNRAWHSAAQSMPFVRAWLRLSQVSDGRLEDVSRALTMLSVVRQANGSSKKACLEGMRYGLRRHKCLTASKQLRALFDSVQIVSKQAGEKTGSARMRFTRPSAATATAASSSSSAASSSSSSPAVPALEDVELTVSFDVDRPLGDHAKQHTHRITMGYSLKLVDFYRSGSDDGYTAREGRYRAGEMMSWLCGLGVMRGSRDQQIAMLEAAIVTLFDLCDSRHQLEWDEPHSDACAQAYDEEAEEQQQQAQEQGQAEAEAEAEIEEASEDREEGEEDA